MQTSSLFFNLKYVHRRASRWASKEATNTSHLTVTPENGGHTNKSEERSREATRGAWHAANGLSVTRARS